MERAQVVLDFLLRRQQRSQWIRYETGSEIKLYTRKKIAIQVDGEPLGYTTTGSQPTVLRVAPKALKVIVPRTLPGDLFTIEP
jgi:diacylglycerol kinase family enzyme